MKIDGWLKQAQKQLENSGVGTARLDALVLLEDATKIDRAQLLAEPNLEISAGQLAKLKKLLNRRASHEPLAYIRGKTEFYGREFVLTPAVLEPRPESETMIELLKALVKDNPLWARDTPNIHIADVGTGSGALGITAKLELPKTRVDLLEIEPKALKVAKTNVDKFTLSINVIKSDLLSQSSQSYDILLCNLPYVPDDYHINQAAAREPRIAIFGGPDGLDVYRQLFKQVQNLKKQPLYILTEALPPQHAFLTTIARQAGYKPRSAEDFIQIFERGN